MTIRQGLPPERAWVVPNAIDSVALRPVQRRAELVERYGLGGRTVMGFAGWFDHWDRLELLIGALVALQPEFPELAVLLIGDGPTLRPLRERVERDGQAADVVLAGAVPRSLLHEHLALLDIAVLPHSNRFGSPVVMFEFMARRLPIAAPRLPPIEDVLEDGHNALLFDPLDQDGLIAALRRYLSSERLRTRLSDAAYAQLVRRHTWERNAEAIIDAAGFGPVTPSTLQVEELRRAG